MIHGLRILIQNAVDFAESTVWVDLEWTLHQIRIRIVDDGPGFPTHIIHRIGDPFGRLRREADQEEEHTEGLRPEYEGMGLGLFIAKTLLERAGLERAGTELTFADAMGPFLAPAERPERGGAVVEIVWPEAVLLAPARGVPGENPPNRN